MTAADKALRRNVTFTFFFDDGSAVALRSDGSGEVYTPAGAKASASKAWDAERFYWREVLGRADDLTSSKRRAIYQECPA